MSSREVTSVDYQLNWRKLQQVGLNAYEARSYLVLLGHPRFKALELAARAHVPRQKIYEVLDSLVEKGFAQVMQERTKLFSAVDPSLAVPAYLGRRSKMLQNELTEQSRLASGLIEDLRMSFLEGQDGRGTLDFLSLVNDPMQTAVHYRRMLATATRDYSEFSRPPFAVDPLDEQLVKDAACRGVNCRLLIESGVIDEQHRHRLREYRNVGIKIRFVDRLPMKLASLRRKMRTRRSPRPRPHASLLDRRHLRTRRLRRSHGGPLRNLLVPRRRARPQSAAAVYQLQP